jgi:hypothetical protein
MRTAATTVMGKESTFVPVNHPAAMGKQSTFVPVNQGA